MAWFECTGGSGGGETVTKYIASSCAQQLNLPVYMDEDILIKTKIMIPQTYPSETSIINNEWNVYCMAFYIANGGLCLRDTSSRIVSFANKPWKWVDIEFKTSDGSIKYDGVTYGGQGGNYNHKVISLFGIENGHYSSVAMQTIEIYKSRRRRQHDLPTGRYPVAPLPHYPQSFTCNLDILDKVVHDHGSFSSLRSLRLKQSTGNWNWYWQHFHIGNISLSPYAERRRTS